MSVSPHAVLRTTVEAYDADGEPVSVETIAASTGTTASQVVPVLRSLQQAEFVVETDDGYRPTITAREFLELGVTLESVTAVDVVEE